MLNQDLVKKKVIQALNDSGLSVGESLVVLDELHKAVKNQFEQAEKLTQK